MIDQNDTESPQPVAEAESLVGVAMHDLLAVPPFTPSGYGHFNGADGERVITCDDSVPPCALYSELKVDAEPWFMCPKCGRLGQRMEEATEAQILSANTKDHQREASGGSDCS